MSEMVERVARAIEQHCHDAGLGYSAVYIDTEAAARAAIKAMREQTDDMVDAAIKESQNKNGTIQSIWESSIDAALGKEGS